MISEKQLDECNAEVSRCQSSKALRRQLVRFAYLMGFETIDAIAVFDQAHGESEFHGVDNMPADYRLTYEDRRLGQLDPVMQFCKHSSQSIYWNQDTYVSEGMGRLWEVQSKFGLSAGIALAIHSPGGRHVFVGMDRDKAVNLKSVERHDLDRIVRSFTLHVQDVAFRIFDPNYDRHEPQLSLSKTEVELLKWSSDGKSNKEAAQLMNMTETEALAYLTSALRKLNCVSKYHAATKAMRLGLLR